MERFWCNQDAETAHTEITKSQNKLKKRSHSRAGRVRPPKLTLFLRLLRSTSHSDSTWPSPPLHTESTHEPVIRSSSFKVGRQKPPNQHPPRHPATERPPPSTPSPQTARRNHHRKKCHRITTARRTYHAHSFRPSRRRSGRSVKCTRFLRTAITTRCCWSGRGGGASRCDVLVGFPWQTLSLKRARVAEPASEIFRQEPSCGRLSLALSLARWPTGCAASRGYFSGEGSGPPVHCRHLSFASGSGGAEASLLVGFTARLQSCAKEGEEEVKRNWSGSVVW